MSRIKLDFEYLVEALFNSNIDKKIYQNIIKYFVKDKDEENIYGFFSLDFSKLYPDIFSYPKSNGKNTINFNEFDKIKLNKDGHVTIHNFNKDRYESILNAFPNLKTLTLDRLEDYQEDIELKLKKLKI